MTTELHVDASAIVAIILEEPGHQMLMDRMTDFDVKITSVVSAFEAVMAVGRVTGQRTQALDIVSTFLHGGNVTIAETGAALLDDLADAHVAFGKGSGHPARLNMGDCFSYALAKRDAMPLLYQGDDFAQTDLA